MNARCRVAVLVLSLSVSFAAWAQSGEHWVSTWAASPQQRVTFPQPPRPVGAQPGPGQANAAAPVNPFATGANFNHQTVRMVVHTSIGGRRVRVQLSNAYGTAALMIGAAHIARRDKDSAI